MNQSSELMAELDTVGDIIARAEANLTAGVEFDFTPLESRIEELCTRIEGLPPAEGRALQSRLLALADSFGQLTRSIETALSEVKAEMGGVSGRQRAASAYAKTSEPKS